MRLGSASARLMRLNCPASISPDGSSIAIRISVDRVAEYRTAGDVWKQAADEEECHGDHKQPPDSGLKHAGDHGSSELLPDDGPFQRTGGQKRKARLQYS